MRTAVGQAMAEAPAVVARSMGRQAQDALPTVKRMATIVQERASPPTVVRQST
jgi:hypothetical protein